MNRNILIVLCGAVLVAILVAVLVQVILGEEPEEIPVAVVEKPYILVAAKDLKIGSELGSGDLRWQEWPESGLFPGAVRQERSQKPEEALSGRLSRDVAQGEPVMKSAILGEAKGNFVAASLGPGMRAMAIDVKASGMVAGFIGPGDFVDVILTYRETIRTKDEDPRIQNMIQQNLAKLATETILQNVKVLAVDQAAQRPKDDEVKIGKTVTLALSAQNSERLALAAELGELSLVLRGLGDDKNVEKQWPTISDARLTNIGDEVFAEYERLKKDTSINPNIVRIYSGGTVRVVPVQ